MIKVFPLKNNRDYNILFKGDLMDIQKNKSAFIIVDVQNDFCTGGALEVKGGEEVVPGINALLQRDLFGKVVFTADWHPDNHISFASTHQRKPLEIVETKTGLQTLWPDHCVEGSRGAEFHPFLGVEKGDLVLRKGRGKNLDSYSAFFENDKKTSTGLAGYFRDLNISDIYISGLAFDWCVFFSAMDAVSLGFRAVVVEDLTRAVNFPEGFQDEKREEMIKAGVEIIQSGEL